MVETVGNLVCPAEFRMVGLGKLLHHVEAVNPGVETMLVSASTGEGVEDWRRWLERVAVREPAALSSRS